MPRFTDEEINALKQNTDLVALIQDSGVTLTPSGNNFIGLCPFHNDTEPSLVVTPKKQLWNCLGACSEGGSAIDWVMKSRQLDFKDAVTFLKTGHSASNTPQRITLNDITDHYHKRLLESKTALNYLKQRGLTKAELYSRFKIGFADGSLSQMIDDGQKEALKQIGIFRKKGREHFKGYLTIPLYDRHNRVVGIYGRAINSRLAIRHLYLKGDHTGLFNPKASKVYSHMILTESLLDALSLLEMGIENVQALYGVNGLTEEHVQSLNTHRVKSITLSLNNDTAGHKATDTLKELLTEEGFQVNVIHPELKDWNDVLTQHQPVEEISKQIRELFKHTLKSTETEPSKPLNSRFSSITTDALGTLFVTSDLIYKLTELKELFVSSLRVGIKATEKATKEEKGESWYDRLDLYFVNQHLSS